MIDLVPGVVGREAEVASVEAFLDGVPAGPSGLVIEGEPGIGKTTLWQAGIAAARGRSYGVLACTPAEAERRLPFMALGDLLDAIPGEAVADLPKPQRAALDVALLRSDRSGSVPNWRAVALAVLGILRHLGADAPTIVAVDDLQWLDPSSARVLASALRRLKAEPVALLAAQRLGASDPVPLPPAIPEGRRRRVSLGALTPQQLGELLRSRLGGNIGPEALAGLHEASGGNPFFALEIGREVLARGVPATSRLALPVPDDLRDLVAWRIERLSDPAREVVLVAAILPGCTHGMLDEALGRRLRSALAEALDEGVLERRGERIRTTHPLLGSVVYERTSLRRRNRLHSRLASLVPDPERRAWHLALAAEGPDAAVAGALENAAARARARGAPDAAAELAEQARWLTPPEQGEDRRRRTLAVAEHRLDSGETERAATLIEEELAGAAAGRERAALVERLARIRWFQGDAERATELYRDALAQAPDDPRIACVAAEGLAWARWFSGDFREALVHGRAAARAAEALDDPVARAEASAERAWWESLAGKGIRYDLLEPALRLERAESSVRILRRPSLFKTILMLLEGDLSRARGRFEAFAREATETGEEASLAYLLLFLSQLELRTGNWSRAAAYAEQGLQAARHSEQAFTHAWLAATVAMLDAHRGRLEPARAGAEEMLANGAQTYPAWRSRHALGLAALSTGDADEACAHLVPAMQRASATGVGEPGWEHTLFTDGIEALIVAGRVEEAAPVLDGFEGRARGLRRAVALAPALRCRALLLAAEGRIDDALHAAEEALSLHEEAPEPFELARTLLVQGALLRRARHKAAARESLGRAREIFERLGAPLWSAKAEDELSRIGGRAPAPFELTPTEQQVVDAVAAGRTNREVADALSLSVRTVGWHLSNIYRKLGIRSRGELIASAAGAPAPGNDAGAMPEPH